MLLIKEYSFVIKFISIETVDVRSKFIKNEEKSGSYKIIYIVRGSISVLEGRAINNLDEGDVIILFPNTASVLVPTTNSGAMYYVLEIILLASDKIGFDSKIIHAQHNVRLLELFKYLIYMSGAEGYTDSMYVSCVSLILSELAVGELSEQVNRRWILLMNEVRNWLRMNAAENARPLENVAKQFGYSKEHISRMFKKTFGQSIHTYIDELKLGMAVNLLINTDLPISKIADALGYPSADLFIKFFKYHRSCPPGAFRKNIRSTEE